MNRKILTAFLFLLLGAGVLFFVFYKTETVSPEFSIDYPDYKELPPEPEGLPVRKVLPNDYHVLQTFNNCAPAALSMALSYFGVRVSQEELADSLRPVHNLSGKNDDKSTTPYELADEAKKYGLVPYFRPGGNIEILKQFIANDIPVVVRTLLKNEEDFAHYRVVKGYDDLTSELIEDDGYQGDNISFSYDDFMDIWQPFNYGYLALVPKDKQDVAEAIIGRNMDPIWAWKNAVKVSEQKLKNNPGNIREVFNLSVALYYAGEYDRSVEEFEKVESKLPVHTIWYQIEPIEAYFKLGNYERVFSLTDSILNNKNPAYSELYILRGNSYLKEGNVKMAKEEFEKAVFYNKNLASAREALASVDTN
ncbi:MAG: C39 family peptidase [Candidatus Paceibacterota bacterium]|jgi:hypothetical protein